MSREITVVNIEDKLSLFSEHWSPKIIGDLDGFHIKIAKLQGEFLWHSHENEDELFLVIKGSLTIKLRERDLTIREGEFVVIPQGVEHKPVATEEVHVVLIEPKSTVNTGDAGGERTVARLERI